MSAIVRWWRAWFNPNPQPGQFWDLDGLGLRWVIAVKRREFNGGMSARLVVTHEAIGGGDSHDWFIEEVRAQGRMRRRLTAEEFGGAVEQRRLGGRA